MKKDIFWEGETSINNIRFNCSRDNDYKLPEANVQEAEEIWQNEKVKFPHIYNGNLVYVKSMNINSSINLSINFTSGIMKFSDLIYLARTETTFKELKGYLSFKIILKINDKSNQKYLLGMKSSCSEFDPLNWTMPGGVVEEKEGIGVDLFDSVHNEIVEETGLPNVKNEVMCHLITKDVRNLGIGMILSLEIDSEMEDDIRENEEFEPSSFTWMSSHEILALDDEKILGDVTSLKYLIRKNSI